MKEIIEKLRAKAMEEIAKSDDIEALRIKYLGKKGELTALLRGMGSVSPEDRPKIGQLVNELRETIEGEIDQKKKDLSEKALEMKLKAQTIDVTMPGKEIPVGRLGTPEEVAGAVAFFTAEENGYITGQVLGVNGGFVV